MIDEYVWKKGEELAANYMKNNGYNILSMYKIPTKLFMELTSITIEEFIEKAEIERRLNNGDN